MQGLVDGQDGPVQQGATVTNGKRHFALSQRISPPQLPITWPNV
ncbi:hypothetical protein GFS31_23930 [Leptolyngbya sp. BL0902]|nr:hypothetical protein GFS31_23930 [Leptolyngbya sp. BL0902]